MLKKAIVLFSGGVDSTTCLAIARHQGFECQALSFDYGQKHRAELEASQKIAKHFNIPHHVIKLPSEQFSGSALVSKEVMAPNYEAKEADQIPVTYVPARNTIFLSFALGYAEVLKANDIFIGVSAIDYSNYPDCRPEYIEAFQRLANLATQTAIEGTLMTIHAPLVQLSKADTLLLGKKLGVDYAMTVSCYRADSQGRACGTCHSCTLRRKGFDEAGISDPTRYANDADT